MKYIVLQVILDEIYTNYTYNYYSFYVVYNKLNININIMSLIASKRL